MRYVLVFLVDAYRLLISRHLPPLCRYQPTCSTYAREALLRHGAVKGSLLAAWRILRCNPFGGFGDDPVPPRRPRHAGCARPPAATRPPSP